MFGPYHNPAHLVVGLCARFARAPARRSASRGVPLLRIALVIAVVLVVAVAGWLATRDIPAPTHPVEKVISDDRLPR